MRPLNDGLLEVGRWRDVTERGAFVEYNTGDVVDALLDDGRIVRARIAKVLFDSGVYQLDGGRAPREPLPCERLRRPGGWEGVPGCEMHSHGARGQKVAWLCPALDELAGLARGIARADDRRQAHALIELARASVVQLRRNAADRFHDLAAETHTHAGRAAPPPPVRALTFRSPV